MISMMKMISEWQKTVRQISIAMNQTRVPAYGACISSANTPCLKPQNTQNLLDEYTSLKNFSSHQLE